MSLDITLNEVNFSRSNESQIYFAKSKPYYFRHTGSPKANFFNLDCHCGKYALGEIGSSTSKEIIKLSE